MLKILEIMYNYIMDKLFVLDYGTFGDDYINVAKRSIQNYDKVWLRVKNIDISTIYTLAHKLKQEINKPLILSERADIAHALGYYGVHLSKTSMPAEVVKVAYPSLVVGYSAHSIAECIDTKADYTTLSPLKDIVKNDVAIKGLGMVGAPCNNVYALGGMSNDIIGDITSLGYVGIAGITMFSEF